MASLLTRYFKKIISIIPISKATWIYTKIINKTPLRYPTNWLLKKTIPKEFIIPEGIVVLNQDDVAVSGMIALESYESYETKLFREILKEGMTVVDIGANIGYYSVIAGKRVGTNGKVFSFEPENINFSFLEKNISKNSLRNTKAFQTALSDKPGTQNLFLYKENKGSYSLVDNRKTKVSIPVAVDTLDNVLGRNNISSVDIIKIDIEGGEYLAFLGAKEILSKSSKLIVMTEFFPNAIRRFNKDPLDFLKLFRDRGFSISLINEDKKELTPIKNIEEFLKDFSGSEIMVNLYITK